MAVGFIIYLPLSAIIDLSVFLLEGIMSDIIYLEQYAENHLKHQGTGSPMRFWSASGAAVLRDKEDGSGEHDAFKQVLDRPLALKKSATRSFWRKLKAALTPLYSATAGRVFQGMERRQSDRLLGEIMVLATALNRDNFTLKVEYAGVIANFYCIAYPGGQEKCANPVYLVTGGHRKGEITQGLRPAKLREAIRKIHILSDAADVTHPRRPSPRGA